MKSLRSDSRLPKVGQIIIDCNGIEEIDTASMLFFIGIRKALKSGLKVSAMGMTPSFLRLFRVMLRYYPDTCLIAPKSSGFVSRWPYWIGKKVVLAADDFLLFLDFLGCSTVTFLKGLICPSTIRLNEIALNIQNVCVMAVPIIALSAFLIGIVIAFQSAVQLKNYGANIFIADMVGISIPRELSSLITAIVVAGRSVSAFTAQIGAMKVAEELDAMRPLALISTASLSFLASWPLLSPCRFLSFLQTWSASMPGMLVSSIQLGISPAQFLERLKEAVSIRHYLIGLLKGPFFALAIASIGCFRGLQVSRNTQSIGRYTTISVVNSIFAVILLDAIFSVIFTELDL